MLTSIALLILSGGLPYYTLLEKSGLSNKNIFRLSALLLLGAIVLTLFVPNEHSTPLVLIALASALFSVYKAAKTTNFYKFA